MSDKKELYADGIEKIHFTDGMVRMDFLTLQPVDEDGKAPEHEVKFRVIMPERGFYAAFTSMNQLMDKLVEAGRLKKVENNDKKSGK